MTRQELIEIALRLEHDASEKELDRLLEALVAALPHSGISDLLYHHSPSLSAEQAIDEALRREQLWREANN